MSKRGKRPLHFAVSTALLVAPAAGLPACGGEEPVVNTPAPPEPVVNTPVVEDPPPPEELGDPINPAATEPEPLPTAHPVAHPVAHPEGPAPDPTQEPPSGGEMSENETAAATMGKPRTHTVNARPRPPAPTTERDALGSLEE